MITAFEEFIASLRQAGLEDGTAIDADVAKIVRTYWDDILSAAYELEKLGLEASQRLRRDDLTEL